MLRFARNDVKGRFRVKLGMMYEKEMPRQAEHDKLVKNWRNKRNSVQGECRDRPLAGWHDRTAAADAEGVQQLTPQNGRLPTGRFIKYACTKTMRQACAGRRRERPSYSLCMKVSKFQVENKRKLYLQGNIDFWNGKRWHLPFLLQKSDLKP